MQRILSLVATCAIALAPALLTGAVLVAPALSTSGNVSATSTATKTTTTTISTTTVAVSQASTGNGAPSGSHYNLNIIGVPKDKTADMNNNDGRRIFVRLTGGESATNLNNKVFSDILKVNTILLMPAPVGDETFKVLDANATDSSGAIFQLPYDVSTTWKVWARALGTPNGKANMTTCATVQVVDATGATVDEVECSLTTLEVKRTKNAKFMDVSSYLLFITYAVDPAVDTALATCLGITTTTTVTLPIFGGCLSNYFWNYQNDGLKLLQLRFYPAAAGGTSP